MQVRTILEAILQAQLALLNDKQLKAYYERYPKEA